MNARTTGMGLLALMIAVPAASQTGRGTLADQEVQMRTPGVAPQTAQAVVESKVTTGRPYSAEATTEFVQVLGDGNRIARKATVRIYRDGEGRTRREELGTDGQVKSISIYDPVAHVSYVLDPVRRVATKASLRVVFPQGRGRIPSPEQAEKMTAERNAAETVPGRVALVAPVEAPGQAASDSLLKIQAEVVARSGGRGVLQPAMRGGGDAKSEPLGQKMLDGVLAEGSRTTTVIPAGAIGNERAITVVTEQWFSPDLEILLMTKHSDPRGGESTYTVSNITRGEPGAGLFDVPSDYTIRESSYMRTPALR